MFVQIHGTQKSHTIKNKNTFYCKELMKTILQDIFVDVFFNFNQRFKVENSLN